MKKVLGYGIFYLIGLLCVVSMMCRVDALDNSNNNKIVKESTLEYR